MGGTFLTGRGPPFFVAREVTVTERQSRQLKAAFLEQFRLCGNISQSCRAVGLTNRTEVYKWQERDDDFAGAYRQAELEAVELLEQEARRRAVEGTTRESGVYHQGQLVATEVETRYSDTLLIFLLKGLKPEKYRERLDLNVNQVVKAYAGFDPSEVV